MLLRHNSFLPQGERERAEALSRFNRTRRRVRRGRAIFTAENTFSRVKIVSLQKSIVPIGHDGFLEGVVVEGELATPPQYYDSSSATASLSSSQIS